jgi:uncharacterized protein (DUF2237 family)
MAGLFCCHKLIHNRALTTPRHPSPSFTLGCFSFDFFSGPLQFNMMRLSILPLLLFSAILTCQGFANNLFRQESRSSGAFIRTRRNYASFSFFKARHPHSVNMASDNNSANESKNEDEGDDDEDYDEESYKPSSVNVIGTTLEPCCCDVRNTGIGTGFYRNGYCSTGDQDLGRHTVCIEASKEFLAYSASVGNDLSTPMLEYHFPGLLEGDRWCLCAARWVQAYQAGRAPKLFLAASHEKSLSYVPLAILREFSLDKDEADASLKNLNAQREKLNRLLQNE